MGANLTWRGVCLATLILGASPAWSGGAGGHGVFIGNRGGFHGAGAFRAGGVHGSGAFRGFHPLPPIAGTIRERGGQPYWTAYGHANTAFVSPGFHRSGVYDFGRGQAAGDGQGRQQNWPGYGQQQNGAGYGGRERITGYGNGGRDRFGRERIDRRVGDRERLRFAEARRARGLAYGGYGGSGYDSGDDDGGDVGSSPPVGTYGSPGGYDGSRSYPAPGVYESELGGSGYRYRSETPLAARYAEAPLAPSPYSGFDAGNSYADAASRDVGPGSGPRIIHVSAGTSTCTCDRSARTTPLVYRYGVGTAY